MIASPNDESKHKRKYHIIRNNSSGVHLLYLWLMSHHENVKIVAFVGLSGAGKSSAVDYVASKGHPKVHFGRVLLDAMKQAGIEPTWENQNAFRVDIRAREGQDFVVKRIITQINDLIAAGQHRIVADGIYSWDEYKIMKTEFPGELSVIAIVAPKHIRHHRLNIRPERPLTDNEANERDWREIEDIQKGGPIAIADHFIINDGPIMTLQADIDAALHHIKFDE
jgi:dephospho-CoA kinase